MRTNSVVFALFIGLDACGRTTAALDAGPSVDAAEEGPQPISPPTDAAAADIADADVADASPADAGVAAQLMLFHHPGYCRSGSPECKGDSRSLTSAGILRGLGKARRVDPAEVLSIFELARSAFNGRARCVPLRPDAASFEIVLVEGTVRRSIRAAYGACPAKFDQIDDRMSALVGKPLTP